MPASDSRFYLLHLGSISIALFIVLVVTGILALASGLVVAPDGYRYERRSRRRVRLDELARKR